MTFDLGPVDRIAAGAVGPPGERTFYVQARAGGTHVTLLAEKEQIHVLARALIQMLSQVSERPEGLIPQELDLEEPLDPQWRVGEMTIEYDEDADGIAIVIREGLEEDDPKEPATARFVVTREQARALAGHALEVVAAGRPRCQLCGRPISEGEPHVCPSMNGHRAHKE